jgi:hypothetical protein
MKSLDRGMLACQVVIRTVALLLSLCA